LSTRSKGFKGLVLHKASKVWSGTYRTTVWDNNSTNPFAAYCDDNYRIYLPMHMDLNHLRGLAEHECAHIRFTNAKAWKEAIQKVAKITGHSAIVVKEVLNLLEDLRIEILFSKVFKGATTDFNYLLSQLEKEYATKKHYSEEERWSSNLFKTIRFGANINEVGGEVRESIKKQPVFTRVVQGAMKILQSCPYKMDELKFPMCEEIVPVIAKCEEVKKEWDKLSKVLKKVEAEKNKDEVDAALRRIDEDINNISKNAEKDVDAALEKIAKALGTIDSIKATSRKDEEILSPLKRTSSGEKIRINVAEVLPSGEYEKEVEKDISRRLAKLGFVETSFLGVEEKLPSKSGAIRISKAVSRVAGGRGSFFSRIRKVQGVDVLLLIDQSGSMKERDSSCNLRKDFQAILAAAAFQKTLETNVNIKTAIIGFSAVRSELVVNHYLYKKFDEKFNLTKLCRLIGSDENRDGTSIRFAGQYLLNYGRAHSKKILIVVSDGAPWHGGTKYEGLAAIEDTKKAINEVKAQGIVVFGLGINITDKAKETYHYMYGTQVTFMDTAKLTNVIIELARLIQQLVETA